MAQHIVIQQTIFEGNHFHFNQVWLASLSPDPSSNTTSPTIAVPVGLKVMFQSHSTSHSAHFG